VRINLAVYVDLMELVMNANLLQQLLSYTIILVYPNAPPPLTSKQRFAIHVLKGALNAPKLASALPVRKTTCSLMVLALMATAQMELMKRMELA